jgi:hypothetical protein
VKIVAAPLCAEDREVLDFEVAGLFEVMVVGNEVGAFLGARLWSQQNGHGKEEKQSENAPEDMGQKASLQLSCNWK